MSSYEHHQSDNQSKKGRIVLVGAIDMFTDEYFDKEDNAKIFEVILKYLLGENEGFGEGGQN